MVDWRESCWRQSNVERRHWRKWLEEDYCAVECGLEDCIEILLERKGEVTRDEYEDAKFVCANTEGRLGCLGMCESL